MHTWHAFSIWICKARKVKEHVSYEDYAEIFGDADDDYLSTLEEWQNMIDQWLEKPFCINNEEADWLMEYKIISLYQLNKLKRVQAHLRIPAVSL